LTRITATEQRLQDLALLQTEALTKIGKYGNNHDQPSDDDNANMAAGAVVAVSYQEVVCSLNYAQMTAVLRLTPDCPMVPGSVFLDQLVGLGGWDTALVQRIHDKICHETRLYSSPVAVVRALKAEIRRLQQEEGLVLPETPKMPVRGGVGHHW